MNIEYLRNFIKLTQYKSFSELAKDIPISQSTLSHQISQLEKDFGVILIERSTKRFNLTEPGRILLNYAKQIVNLYDGCEAELIKFSEQKLEEIVISASTTPGSHILPKFIAEFRNMNPNVNFKILINNSQKSIENLNKKIAEFAGIGSFLNYNKDDFEYVQIGEDQLKFICAPDHELVKRGNNIVKFEDILKYPFVWREKGSGTRDTFCQQFPDYNKLNIELEINDNDSIISTVSESNYLSIMSEIMAIKAENAGLIKILEIKSHPIIVKRPLFFIRRREEESSELKTSFWNYILRQSKKSFHIK
ncbi:MAG: LysR substrate-binding domain-containing protein [Promethearchaeota archaeon]